MNDGTPDLSILVVNWNTRDLVLQCLDAIPIGVGSSFGYETVVVDNGSVDGSVDVLRPRSDITLVENPRNLGFAAAVNAAYRESSGPLVLLLNSDVELLPGSVGTLVEFMGRRPEVAAAAPLYRNPDGTPQAFHFRFPTFAVTLANASSAVRALPGMTRRLRRFEMVDDDFSRPRAVPQPSASCLLVRRACLGPDEVFDERFPIFFNDVQLARTIAAAGSEMWVTPDALVVHEGHASTRQLGPILKRQYVASVVRMLEDTEPRRNVRLYQALVLAQGLLLRLFRRSGALSVRDLVAAVSGDPGPLPSRPLASR